MIRGGCTERMGCKCYACRRRRRHTIWAAIAIFIGIQGYALSAYMPNFLTPANNLSDVSSASTARTNLGLGTAAVKAASNGSDATLASVTGTYTVGHLATFADTSGSLSDGGANTSVVPSVATAATSASITLSSTNLVTTVVSNTTVATANLISAVTAGNGFRSCVKDGTEDFNAHNVTLKSPTAGTIDGVAGSTGIVMNQTHQELCAISDGSNWFIE